MLLARHRRGRSFLVLTSLFVLLLCTCVRAQDIRLTVIVPNPPPVHWEAYLEFDAEIRVVVTNVGAIPHELKLVPTLTSDRGLSAALQPDYQPLNPLVVGPGETTTLTFREMRALFGTPQEADIALEGISFDRLFASETIPEGSYTLCVEARGFATNEALSNNFGCSVFFVQQHEPPLIIWPFDGEEVTALQPQFLNFLWSTTGVPGRTRYRFALYDLDELGLFNPADAFLLEATRPWFEAEDLVASNLVYDLALPPLTPGHAYAVQVTAYDPDGELLFAQGGRSAVHRFTYTAPQVLVFTPGNGGGVDSEGPNEFQNEGPDQQLMMEACPELPTPPGLPIPYPNNNLTAGQTVTVGGHELVLTTGGALPLAGTGRVRVASLGAWVNVSFTGLNVNAQYQALAGTVTAYQEGNPDLAALTEQTALQLSDLVGANGSWLSGGPEPVNLPAGIAGAGMDLIFTGMTFTPQGATVDLFAKIELPETQQEHRLLLVGQGACLNDEALGQNMDLLLAGDQSFALAAGVEMTFAGGEEGTRLRWSGSGAEELSVDLSLGFAPSVMPGGQAFAARVTADVTDYHDWLGAVTVEGGGPTPGENIGFDLTVGDIVYDHSVTQNPAGMTLPPAYPDPGNDNLWQGLYVEQFNVLFPQGFDVTVAAQDLLLDRTGVWTRVSAQGNLLDISEGEIGGWALGVDGLELDVRESVFAEASFDGRVRLPLGDTEVAFTAPLGEGEDISVALDIGQEVGVDMWLAELELAGNSKVGFIKQGPGYRPQAELHGQISLGWDSVEEAGEDDVGVSQFSLPGVDFQDFKIVGGASPSVEGVFGLDLENVGQGGMQNFPLQLTALDLELVGEDIGLRFGVGLSLMNQQNGFHGSTEFTLIGRRAGGTYVYDRTRLDLLSVEAELNIISLSGSIDLFDDPATYGTGFDGQVSVDIEQVGAGLDMRLMVGRAPENYRYFMVDALVKLPDNAGIPIGATPLAFYGFGGGFWRNMNRQAAMPEAINYDEIETVDQADNAPGEGATTVFLPQSGITGFSMKTIIGLQGAKRALNGDLELYLEMEDDFSLDEIVLSGNVYCVQDLGDRGAAFLHGFGELRLAPEEGLYTLSGDLTVDLPGGLASMQWPLYTGFRTQGNPGWWFYYGQWTPGADPMDDDGRFGMETNLDFGLGQITSERNGYFMLGTEMPDGMPGVPSIVTSQFSKDGKELPGQQFNGNAQSYNTTNGFAFGVGREMDLSFNARIFRLDVGYQWGFDLLLADMSQSECSADDFGLHNWYARGQAWAHCHISGSVEGRLFGRTRSFKFAEMDAAALLNFQGPNPIWIQGTARIKGKALGKLIKFDTQVSFEFGEKIDCRDGGGNIFDEIPIVQEISPRQGVKGKSIFTAPEVSFNFPNRALTIDEGEGDEVDNHYYGYKLNSIVVETMGADDDNFETFYTDNDPQGRYDDEGYAAIFDLPELPPNSKIKFIIEVRAEEYEEPWGATVKQPFGNQKEERIFETGPPPDHIMKGSVVNSVPFRRQLYFTKNDHPTGRIDWYRPQYSDLFRDSPIPEDKLDPAGAYHYIARFVKLDNGVTRDVPLASADVETGLTFPVPTGWLQPESGYRIDVLRMYTPPQSASGPGTDTVLVDLELYEGNPYTFDGGLSVGGGGGGEEPGGNPGQTLVFQGGGQAAASSGNTQMLFFNGGGQAGNGMAQVATFANGPDNPGPDPPFEPELGFQNQGGGGPGLGGPDDFANPGGDMAGLSRYSRELREESRTSATVAKSLWPRNQSPWYFRTSRYDRLSTKINQLDVVDNGPTRYRTEKVDADNLYAHNIEYVKLPYVIMRTNEAFDRYETRYWKRKFQARDKGQKVGSPHTRKFYPAVEVTGESGMWRDHTFYGSPDVGTSTGLFRQPLGDVDDWCLETFDEPDGPELTTTPCAAEDGHNAPLHHFSLHTWDVYMTVVPGPKAWGNDSPPGMNNIGYQQWRSQTRYGADEPFGRNAYQRRLPSPTNMSWEADLPTVEITEWKKTGTPDGLAGSGAESTRTWLTDGMIDALQGNGQVNPGLFDGNMSLAGEEPEPIQFAQGQKYLTLTDYTEWMTLKDYFGMRQIISDGIDEILDVAENDLDLDPGPNQGAACDEIVLLDCNPDGDGDPAPPGPLPDLDGVRPFAVFYYPQIRRYLMHKSEDHFGQGGQDYHGYNPRPAGTYRVLLNGQPVEYALPKVNDNPDLN